MRPGPGDWERSQDIRVGGVAWVSHQGASWKPGFANAVLWSSSVYCDLAMLVRLLCTESLFPCSQGKPLFQRVGTHVRVPRHVAPIRPMKEPGPDWEIQGILGNETFYEPQRQELPLHCSSPASNHNLAGRHLPSLHLRAGLPGLAELGVLAPV